MPKKGANLGESSDSAMMAACVSSLSRQGPDTRSGTPCLVSDWRAL